MEKPLLVKAFWDEEAKVWVAISEEIPGLATEAETMEALIEKLKVIIPELLKYNLGQESIEIPVEILSSRKERIRLSA